MSVGRSNSRPPSRPRWPLVPERHHQLAVVGELVNLVELIVEHPYVLLGIVRAHLDLVRAAPARRVEQLVVLRPPLHHLAGAIDDEDHVVIAALPAALLGRLARRALAIVVAGGAAARGREQRVRRPGLGARRQRQLAALSDPDAIGRLGEHRADRTPGPAIVLDAVWSVGQRLRPVRHRFVRTELLLSASLLQCGSGHAAGREGTASAAMHRIASND